MSRPIVLNVLLMITAGIFYLGIVHKSLKTPEIKNFTLLILIGLVLRVLWFGSAPILEDDSYRYFWDGALITAGLNPYEIAPIDALPTSLPIGEPDPRLVEIVSSGFVERVAYPTLSTIYPPLTQAIFAIHHLISPWDLDGWRVVLLGFDIVTALLLVQVLKAVKLPSHYVLIFWLNPLIITETMNAGHMDALLLPFLALATLGLVRFSFNYAAIGLSLAVGIKLWPIMLAPVFMGYWYKQANFLWRPILIFALKVGLLSGLLLLPQILWNLHASAGLVAYSTSWQTNAMLFQGLEAFWYFIIPDHSDEAARLTSIVLLGCMLLLASIFPKQQPAKQLLWLTAALFLLSPTGYPWYFSWLLPFLVLTPNMALLALTATLPLYDLRFLALFELNPELFNWFIVPLQFLPIAILLLYKPKPTLNTLPRYA